MHAHNSQLHIRGICFRITYCCMRRFCLKVWEFSTYSVGWGSNPGSDLLWNISRITLSFYRVSCHRKLHIYFTCLVSRVLPWELQTIERVPLTLFQVLWCILMRFSFLLDNCSDVLRENFKSVLHYDHTQSEAQNTIHELLTTVTHIIVLQH